MYRVFGEIPVRRHRPTSAASEAVLLGRLSAESIVAPRKPARGIGWARCVAAALAKEAELEQGGRFFYHGDRRVDRR